MITLYTFGPYFGLPDPSPFVMKAEMLLKLSNREYQTNTRGFPRAPKGKLPYIEDGGTIIADSTLIRMHLERRHAVDFDRGRPEDCHRASGDPNAIDRDGVRARVPQLVDEVVHRRRIERPIDIDHDPLALDPPESAECSQAVEGLLGQLEDGLTLDLGSLVLADPLPQVGEPVAELDVARR